MTAILLACILLAPSAPQTEIGEPLVGVNSERASDGGPLEPGNGIQGVLSSEGTLSKALPPGAHLPDTATVQTGTATWCAPTPTHCQSWGGSAMKGAVQSFRYGDTPYRVKVCRVGTGRCVTVTVVSYCACGITLIDLSPAAFQRLAPLSRGRIPVTVTKGGRVVLPPTSTLEGTP